MNKKFSTLVATLLVAGAGMTLNAEVIKVATPKAGGSYLIATSVTRDVEAGTDDGEVEGATRYSVSELKTLLGASFTLSIADADKIEGAELFGGNLVPMGPNAFSTTGGDDSNDHFYRLKNGNQFIVLNTKKIWTGNVGDETLRRGAKFELVDEKDLRNKYYLSYFKISAEAASESGDIKVEVLDADLSSTAYGRLFAVAAGENKYLTTSVDKADNETWLSVKLGASNIVDVKTLLGKYWNISYAASKETAKEEKEEYKLNGVLVPFTEFHNVTEGQRADYVNASTVLLSSPETQWAVVKADAATNAFTLKNRESNVTVEDVILRTTNTSNVYSVISAVNEEDEAAAIALDTIKLTAVANAKKFDGYLQTTPNALRNEVYNIGQYHYETGNVNAYWAENHGANGTHQLGLSTTEKVDWRLSMDTKAKGQITEVDTIYVVTKFAKLDGNKIVDEATPDTLAVLPYLFQNKSNLEYVKYKEEGFNYYVCDETPDVKANGQRFALKLKPNGYNIVSMWPEDSDYDDNREVLLGNKVYASNSVQWGSLTQMSMYAKDDNSVMVVKRVDRPEYRKVAKEWGDIVKIYREEYPTEVLFEKSDSKSVVDGKTLSFLNVNNSVSGANPALFVDTAYVNRVDADGIKNTCYQYMLGVNVAEVDTTYCPDDPEHNTEAWKAAHGGPCGHAVKHKAVKGRYLINLVDTAFAYKQENLHNNPYVNNVEANENLAKLSFVEGIHADDTLYITRKGGEVVKLPMDSSNFNVAKFAFRYVDNEKGSFKIQTQFKNYESDLDQTKVDLEGTRSNEGYLRWVNGTIVVTKNYLNGEEFNMEENYDGKAVANEDITTATFSVATTDGAVVIKGAAGKKVTISNVLGQTVASAVLSSDEATIAAPKGYVTVAIEGEAAVKAIVK